MISDLPSQIAYEARKLIPNYCTQFIFYPLLILILILLYPDMTRCKDTINFSFTPFFTPLVTPNVTPWLAILPTLVRVIYATFVMHKTTVYKQKYAA